MDVAEYRLRPSAQADIEAIWSHTCREWSVEQAEVYLDGIFATLDMLAATPLIGRSIEHVKAGYRQHPSGSHLIFYKVAKYGIEVVRILHGRMNIPSHLKD